jgi:hypothetical protein
LAPESLYAAFRARLAANVAERLVFVSPDEFGAIVAIAGKLRPTFKATRKSSCSSR